MITILLVTAVTCLLFSLILAVPGFSKGVSYLINKVVFTINSEQNLRAGLAISLFLISMCAFFLIYYYKTIR